jgi:hypothetical protein
VDGKVVADVSDNGKRFVDITFTSLSPGAPLRHVFTPDFHTVGYGRSWGV